MKTSSRRWLRMLPPTDSLARSVLAPSLAPSLSGVLFFCLCCVVLSGCSLSLAVSLSLSLARALSRSLSLLSLSRCSLFLLSLSGAFFVTLFWLAFRVPQSLHLLLCTQTRPLTSVIRQVTPLPGSLAEHGSDYHTLFKSF
eukprot:291172-Rhodomonas_salina.1